MRLAPKGKVLEAAENEADGGSASPRKAAASARVDVPAGSFHAGSTPGDLGREPGLEPAWLKVDLGAYAIDRYLYPNDPSKPPLTGVTRARASELCQQAGGRLCTELEWERACKGPEESPFPSGAAWDPACAERPAECATGFGVLGMAGALREWTASDVIPLEKSDGARAAAVRGASASEPASAHRCARRKPEDPGRAEENTGFRCCHGPPNAATIPAPKHEQTFRRAELSEAEANEMLSSLPQLSSPGPLTFFKEPDAVAAVLARGDAGAPSGVTMTTSPLLWSPVPGEEILVLSGKTGKDSLIVALYRLPEGRFRLASSFLLKNDKGPIVFAYNGYVRTRLAWSACWECPAESGHVRYRDEGRVVITQE